MAVIKREDKRTRAVRNKSRRIFPVQEDLVLRMQEWLQENPTTKLDAQLAQISPTRDSC